MMSRNDDRSKEEGGCTVPTFSSRKPAMASSSNIIRSASLRTMFAIQREPEMRDSVFCTLNDLEMGLCTLSEELESFGLSTVTANNDDLQSVELLKSTLVKLTNASWSLVQKHRMLIKVHDQTNEVQHRINNDNANLTNHVKRLKEDLEKKQNMLSEVLEKERRLKVKCDDLTRHFKHEKDENVKLRKQLQSKDSQHLHELRRIQQTGHKLREQLQKSVGTYVPRDKVSQNLQADHERQLNIYKQKVRRLEENNTVMLQEINDLRDALTLHSDAINLQAEASGIWNDVET